jgi:hypothetical protein
MSLVVELLVPLEEHLLYGQMQTALGRPGTERVEYMWQVFTAGQPRGRDPSLAADCSLSHTPSCQRCNSILEETLTAATESTSDESSLEVVN